MDQQQIMEILDGRARGTGPAVLRGCLSVAAGPYSAVLRVRRWAYCNGLLPSHTSAVPVISVGNMTVGGTGKTPMAVWVAGRLIELGRRPAVLTRGYKPERGISDEAELLARLLRRVPGGEWKVPVVVNPNRLAGARSAIAAGADTVVMDDGFQHLRLRRDLDIVLIDATCPFGFGRVLPRGLLREPLSALRAADAVVITRADQVEPSELASLRDRLGELTEQATLHTAVHRPTHLVGLDGQTHSLSELAGRGVLAFCGLGNPGQFFQTLRQSGAALAASKAFDDHVAYTADMLAALDAQARDCGAEVLLTTQKDAIKLPGGWTALPIYALAVEIEVTDGRQELLQRIEGSLRRA